MSTLNTKYTVNVANVNSYTFLIFFFIKFEDTLKMILFLNPLLTSSKVNVWSSSGGGLCPKPCVFYVDPKVYSVLENLIFKSFLKLEKKKEKDTKFALYSWPALGGLGLFSAELQLWQDGLLRAWEHSRITKPPHRFSLFFSHSCRAN